MSYWIKSLIVAFLLLAGCSQSRKLNQKIKENLLHHSMSAAELERYFGASNADEVPEYDVVHPFLSNEKGEFISDQLSNQLARHRRNTSEARVFYYYMKAFGIGLHLNLTLNDNLLGPKFAIETRHKNGTITIASSPSVDLYVGNVISHQGSTVVITYGSGLEGMIKLMDTTFFMQPLPVRLAERHKRSLSSVAHVIVKKSAQDKTSTCDQEETVYGGEIKEENSYSRRSAIGNHTRSNASIPHKYLQTVYVADKYIADFLGQQTLISVLTTLANIVAGLFRDDSFGEIKINYVLNKIIILNSGELSYSHNASSLTKLNHIIDWAKKNNPKSEDDVDHFDTVTLISRGTLGGRSLLGAICTGNLGTANVANIAGINSAVTIAHEVFHNFGYNHDLTPECPNRKYIMATILSSGPASYTWSKCSRDYIQNFLSSGPSDCLNDPPSLTIQRPTALSKLKSELPGEVFDADRQCELQYGISFKACPTTQNQCESLYCTKDNKKCVTNYASPVDGTRCGVRHWCIEGVCVDDGSPMIDGKWGEWSSFESCTRTCGGGVQFRKRKCDNPKPQNGGKDCEGNTRGHFRICSTEACPRGLASFRQVQCSAKGNYKEYIVTNARCSLACRSGQYVYWLGTVVDGTRCYDEEKILDVCVEGHCKEVGCDNNLESGKRLDRCGVCAGDGSSCGLSIVNYTKIHLEYGYAKADTMVTLPVHSTNVVAIKKGVTYNNIGVQSVEGEYLINLPTWSTSVEAAGTTISYIHEDNQYQDRIYIPGPTTHEINLVFVYLYERNHGVDISYYAPANGIVAAGKTHFEWRVSDWSKCSRSCAGGIKTRLIKCVRNDDKTEAGVDYCNQTVRPDILGSCNTQACPPEWYVSTWETCSLTCGQGSQRRRVICRQKISNNIWRTLVNDTWCSESKPEVSPLLRNCNKVNCPPEYVGKEWSKCSTTCSPGVMTRKLECQRRTALGKIEVLPDHWCQEYGSVKPVRTENCNMDSPCEPPSHLEVGCFKLNTEIFPTILADFRDTLDYENVLTTLRACASLAYHRDYKSFGLANDGECRVGPNVTSNFFKLTTTSECNSLVGQMNAIFIYTLEQLPNVSSIGCYTDKPTRALPVLLKNFRNQINWYEINQIVNRCAHAAHNSGYQYFAVQFYGECWSGTDAKHTYNKYGPSTKCWEGVGEHWANFVYKFN